MACGVLFCLIVLPGPGFAGTPQKTLHQVTQAGTVTPPSNAALSGFCGPSVLLSDHAKENEILPVNP